MTGNCFRSQSALDDSLELHGTSSHQVYGDLKAIFQILDGTVNLR